MKSLAKFLLLNFIYPYEVKAVPNLAVRVGKTQSNISTPNAAHKAISTGYPTPIKYLGLFLGRYSQQNLTTLKKVALAYPPARPPIANPLASFLPISSKHLFLKSKSIPPWTIGNKFCVYGFSLAYRFRSIHLKVLSMASYIRGPYVVVLTTSSRAIIMSEPILFWIWMESSGLIFIYDLSYGDWNFTPYSVISHSLLKETIWKPPESVNMFLFQFINLWRPPTASRKFYPGLYAKW